MTTDSYACEVERDWRDGDHVTDAFEVLAGLDEERPVDVDGDGYDRDGE